MSAVFVAVAVALVSALRSGASLHLEILALRYQLAVLHHGGRCPRLKPVDRLLWVWLSRAWSGWQEARAQEEDDAENREQARRQDAAKGSQRPGSAAPAHLLSPPAAA